MQAPEDPSFGRGSTGETVARAATSLDPTASSVLRALRDRLGLDTWVLVHRVEGCWQILRGLRGSAECRGGPVDDGHLSLLLEGTGVLQRPVVASRVARVPKLRGLAALGVGSYVGVPLHDADGAVVGALWGADEHEQPDDLEAQLPFLTLVGELLGAILVAELHAADAELRADEATVASLRDPLTELGNRRLWDRLLVSEEERCRRHGTEATIVVVDVDGLKEINDEAGHAAGDELLRRAARALRDLTRAPDVVTRTGGDEFATIAVDCGGAEAPGVVERLRAALVERGVPASVGYAVRTDVEGLAGAWAHADAEMYRDKHVRRAGLA